MRSDWEDMFEDDFDDEEPTVDTKSDEEDAEKENSSEFYADDEEDDDEIDDSYDDFDEPEEVEKPVKKKPAPIKSKPVKEKKQPKPRNNIHGLKRKEPKEVEVVHANSKGGKIIPIVIGVIVCAGVIVGAWYIAGRQVNNVKETNQNLTQQIENRTRYVYTAKRDLKAGDEIITSGTDANVELSQIYTSLDESAYIDESSSGYVQVDVKAGMPIMSNEIGATNPETEISAAVEEAVSSYTKAKVMPYKITADFIDLATGNSLAESRDLLLDNGANEKAFNTEAETIDGYALSTIKVDGESVHAYGVSEKSMKQGIVSMYYYTSKGGWGRHEIKGNIRVQFGYVKKADNPNIEETTDVFDDSAWIAEDTTAVEESEESTAEEMTGEYLQTENILDENTIETGENTVSEVSENTWVEGAGSGEYTTDAGTE